MLFPEQAGDSGFDAIRVRLPLLAVEIGKDDADLVRRLQRRDPQAMAELYDRYGRRAYVLILRVVRDGSIAEDLVQETFLRVWRRVHGFDGERGALGPWLMAVARNSAIDYLRSAGGRIRYALETETDHPCRFSDLGKEILNLDRVRRVNSALEKLTANQRTVIELAYFEGLSQTEMAKHMRQPVGTVKTWVRSAQNTSASAALGSKTSRTHFFFHVQARRVERTRLWPQG
jgi:RNA polymerase sigma-70 factor (ECF subfamily)